MSNEEGRPSVNANPAAERLPNSESERLLRKRMDGWKYGYQWHAALDAALAAGREATVERIRAAVWNDPRPWSTVSKRDIDAILDAELSASPETDSQAER